MLSNRCFHIFLLAPRARWRIYEGGGGVKGKIVVLCYVGRSEQSPSDGAGGCERSHTSPSTLVRRFPF